MEMKDLICHHVTENDGKEIMIKEGKLTVDATVVDKNIFFS